MGKQSDTLFQRAQEVMPGGVNSPGRAFPGAGTPPFIEMGQGGRIFDADNLQYIDCVGSHGTMILGHGHRYVVEAVKRAATRGFSFGAPTAAEIDLAEMIVEALPSIEMLRLVNSGTEATMSALRLARAATGRKKVLKFEGGYHGDVDSLLVKGGSGATTVPDSAGVPDEVANLTLVARYNDLEDVRAQLYGHRSELAAIIVEPVAANMGCIPPAKGFLEGLRAICDETGALLIFDEVVTGFRLAYGGAQTLTGILPDLTTLGNMVGGGLPMGAYGGSKKLMQLIAPLGPVFQAGTLTGNPVAVAAGRATLSVLKNSSIYDDLEERGAEFEQGVIKAAERHNVPIAMNRAASIWTIFFTDAPVSAFESANRSSREKFARFFQLMLIEGAYLPPSQLQAAFFSAAHAKKDILQLIERTDRAMKKLAWEFGS